MANVLGELFQNIADAIRSKTGSTDTLKPNQFPEAIEGITAGGGGSSGDNRVKYVTFMYGETELIKYPVISGDTCRDPVTNGYISAPTKESTVQYHYTFYGWGASDGGAADANILKNITEDKTVYAIFTATVRYYTITWLDDDGETVLKTESLAYGAIPDYAATKDGYLLDGWIPDVSAVSGDASYTAKWSEVVGGSLSSKASWILQDGVLRVYGTGSMGSYAAYLDLPWYSNRNDIKEVVIEDGITDVAKSAFYNYKNITKVTLGANILTIGKSAFLGTQITSIVIPDSVTNIGNTVFYNCSTLKSVTIGLNVIRIGRDAFANTALISAIFKYYGAWVTSHDENFNSGNATIGADYIADASAAADYLRSSYAASYWKRK
jgi:uncharacterized repeat protein (TIGR02543 family)